MPNPNRAMVFLVDHYQADASTQHRNVAHGLFVHRHDWGCCLPEDVRLALDAWRANDVWDSPGELMRILLELLLEDVHQASTGAELRTHPDEKVDYPVVIVDLVFKQVAFALAGDAIDTEAWTDHMCFQSYCRQLVADYPGEAHEKEVEAVYQSLAAD